jgi:hypothetical protein
MNDFRRIAGAAAVLALCASSAQAATIQISSRDAPGVGFNDPTVVAPVGGNPGTTLGQQRLNVYKYVAHLWEQALDSDVTITVSAGWQALSCSSSTAVLGSASPWNIWHDFPGSKPGTWYPAALANKLAGENLTDGIADDGSGYGNVDIKTQFNINLGQPGCLDGLPFYLGLDGNSGGLIDFAATLEHELGHGLGFTVLTVDTSTGYRLNAAGNAYLASGGLPSIWEGFMVDNTTGKTWLAMTSAERQASALNSLQLAWNSPAMLTAAKATLSALPVIKVTTPAPSGSGLYAYGTAAFGPTVVSGAAFGAGRSRQRRRLRHLQRGHGCSGRGQGRHHRSRHLRLRPQGPERAERGRHRRDHRQQRGRQPARAGRLGADHHHPGGVGLAGRRRDAQGCRRRRQPLRLAHQGRRGDQRLHVGCQQARRRRRAGPPAAVHACHAGGGLVRVALGRERVPEPVDGAQHQRRPDDVAGPAAGPDQAAADRSRLVSPARRP